MVPSLRRVFVIREVNVTTLAQMNKAPVKFAEYVNDKDRKNADAIMKIFVDRYTPSIKHALEKRPWDVDDDEQQVVDIWRDKFSDFWDLIGLKISLHLKQKPADKQRVIELAKKDWRELLRQSREWGESHDLSRRAAIRFPDGYYWVKLDKSECDVEGHLMQHCGLAGGDMWSLRDKQNRPHVTADLYPGEVNQIKGKQNRTPDRKYWPYIKRLFQDLEIDVCLDGELASNREMLTAVGLKYDARYAAEVD